MKENKTKHLWMQCQILFSPTTISWLRIFFFCSFDNDIVWNSNLTFFFFFLVRYFVAIIFHTSKYVFIWKSHFFRMIHMKYIRKITTRFILRIWFWTKCESFLNLGLVGNKLSFFFQFMFCFPFRRSDLCIQNEMKILKVSC